MKNPLKIFLPFLSVFVLFGCNKDKKDATITFYISSTQYFPITISVDGQTETIDDLRIRTIAPVNCNASNSTVTMKVSNGSHTVAWKDKYDRDEKTENIEILDECFIFEID